MQTWKLMAHREHPEEAFRAFCDLGTISIGWADVGDLRSLRPASSSDISKAIRKASPRRTNAHLGGPSLWNFYECTQRGDLVLVAGHGKRMGVFEIVGDYSYASLDKAILGHRHLRPAKLTRIDAGHLWKQCRGKAAVGQALRWTMTLLQDLKVQRTAFEEGRRYQVVLEPAERNRKARAACLKYHGTACTACGFSGALRFGPQGEGLIHVHHTREVHTRSGVYQIDPVRDLIPLCPNCHTLAHRRRPAYSLDELVQMLGYVQRKNFS